MNIQKKKVLKNRLVRQNLIELELKFDTFLSPTSSDLISESNYGHLSPQNIIPWRNFTDDFSLDKYIDDDYRDQKNSKTFLLIK